MRRRKQSRTKARTRKLFCSPPAPAEAEGTNVTPPVGIFPEADAVSVRAASAGLRRDASVFLLAHHLDDESLAALAVKLAVEDRLPGPQIELAGGNRQDCHRNTILLVRLASSCVLHHRIARYSGLIVPKLFPTWGMPYSRWRLRNGRENRSTVGNLACQRGYFGDHRCYESTGG